MAQAGFTPIQLYFSTTAAAVPTAGNLANGELAINITDGKLYYKSNAGVVTLIAGATAGPAGGSNTQVQFNSSGALAGSANMTFNGTTLTAGGLTTTGTTSTGVLSVTGNTTLGDAAADTVTVNGTITSNLIFTDNTYDIGASGATRPRNLYTSGIGLFGGTLFTQTVQLGTSRLTLRDNSLEEYAANSNSAVAVNYTGYLAGTTQFRDFDIYNGKAGFIATFEGATSRFGLNNMSPSYLFDMTGQGRVLSGSGASGATIPANNLFVIDSSANAGFGLAIPATGNIVGGFYVNAGTNQYDGGIDYQGTTRTLNLRAGGGSKVIVDRFGNTGIGITPNPAWAVYPSLQFGGSGTGNTTCPFIASPDSQTLAIGSNSYWDGSVWKAAYSGSITAMKQDVSYNQIIWSYAPAVSVGVTQSFVQGMTYTNSGILLLGTTSTATGIDTGSSQMIVQAPNVSFGAAITAVADSQGRTIRITNQAKNVVGAIDASTTTVNFGTNSVHALTFITAGVERARFDTTGNFEVSSSATNKTVISTGAAIGFTNTTNTSSFDIGLLGGASDATGYIYQRANSAIVFATNSIARATLAAGGNFNLSNNLGLGGATATTSGTGITFPATVSLSSNANTLDDYEEGSWTPDLRFGGAKVGITYIYQSGNYVKIGRQVTVWATIYLSSKGSSTGDASFYGLPYAPSNTFYNEQHGVCGEINNLTFSGYLNSRAGGTEQVQVFQNISGSALTSLNNTNYQNSTSIAITLTYTTNA